MRFAALQGSGTSDYINAGKTAADATVKSFAINRKYSPDYGEIAKTGMKTRSAERVAATEAGAHVAKAGIRAFSDVNKVAIGERAKSAIRDISSKSRKAGGIAAIGKAAAAGFLMSRGDDKRKPPNNIAEKKAMWEKWKANRDNTLAERDANRTDYKPIEQLEGTTPTTPDQTKPADGIDVPDKPTAPASVGTPTKGTAGKVETGVPYSLSGNKKTLADAVAKYESGKWGYEAFNQGGAASGRRVLGKSGSHKEQFGSSLTNMSLGEIFHRQNTEQRGLNMQQHLDSGGLHAVGRYQFIGSTLQDEVKRMGLSHDTKFTPEVQDNIFFSHIKRVGNISPWVGPNDNYSPSQKQQFEGMIRQL